MTRSKPAARQAAMASSRQAGSSLPDPRVAKERKYTRPPASGAAPRSALAWRSPGVAAGAGVPAAPRPVGVDGVHADAVAEQGPAAPAPGGVDGQDGDAQLVLLVDPEAADQLVGQRRLARAARCR